MLHNSLVLLIFYFLEKLANKNSLSEIFLLIEIKNIPHLRSMGVPMLSIRILPQSKHNNVQPSVSHAI